MSSKAITALYSFGYVICLFFPCELKSQNTTQSDSSNAVFPLERSTYFVGECIPVGIQAQSEIKLDVFDSSERLAATGTGNGMAWRIETSNLAPGAYLLRVNGENYLAFTLTDPIRPSPGALFDESLPTLAAAKVQPKDTEKSKEVLAGYQTAMQESGLNALIGLIPDLKTRFKEQDLYAKFRASVYLNPYDRAWSFFGARAYEPELETATHHMVQIAQANLRYPTFAGFVYHWDPVGFDRNGLFVYWGQSNPAGLKKYIEASYAPIVESFRKKTGFEPPSREEHLSYCLAVGRPEFARVVDLPTSRLVNAIATKMPPMDEQKKKDIAVRCAAWTEHLSGILGEANAYHQAWLRKVEPSLRNTSSHDTQFTPNEGSWQQASYKPLDFRFVEAWSDQVDGPDYIYQWLYNAALAEMGAQPSEPVWVGTSLAYTYRAAKYPGRFSRAGAQILAYNGRGLGLTLEGMSNLLGGMYKDTNWWNMKGTYGAEDFLMGRKWIERFAPLQEQTGTTRKVGVLLSLTQFSQQFDSISFFKPIFNIFISLVRLGYTPHFVSESDIAEGRLDGFNDLVIVNQTADLPEHVIAKIRDFQKADGKVFLTVNSLQRIPDAIALEVDEPFRGARRPFNWMTPNVVGEHGSMILEPRFDQLAGSIRAALGNKSRTVLLPEGDEQSRITTLGIPGGSDATYVIATNDSFVDTQSSWARQDIRFLPNGAEPYKALYDLSDEKYLGEVAPFIAKFQDRTARLFALLTRPVKDINLQASQEVSGGGMLTLAVGFVDDRGTSLKAAIPIYLEWKDPSGTLRASYHRATDIQGVFQMQIPVAKNDPSGEWSLSVRSLLDGRVVTLPVQVMAGGTEKLLPVEEAVIVRGDLPGFWKEKPKLSAPIFDGPGKEERLAAAQAAKECLAKVGVELEVQNEPVFGNYYVRYAPTEQEISENLAAERGETIGVIDLKIKESGFFSRMSRHIYGCPVLLFDVVPAKDNPMSENLEAVGMLWPQVSKAFPGNGRAVIQRIKSPFKLGVDAVVVQASDGPGLLAGARALADPPADWISQGVSAARLTLQREFSIGRTPFETAGGNLSPSSKLTDKGRVISESRFPLGLNMSLSKEQPPLRAEVKPPEPEHHPANTIPGVLEPKTNLKPYYKPESEWIPAWTIESGNYVSDLRFSDALMAKVQVEEAGKFDVKVAGLFRYSDRKPRTQAQWVDIIDTYMNLVKPTREPMAFDIMVDGQPAGSLSVPLVDEREVEVVAPAASSGKPGVFEKEEVVVELSGSLELPQGEHRLLFIPKNIVDGKLTNISFSK